MKKLIRVGLLSAITIGLVILVMSFTKLHFNRTESSPYGAFLCIQGLRPSLGDFVSIKGHQTEYFKDLHYTKRMVGVPGDSIQVIEGQIFVENRPQGYVRGTTLDGKMLTPIHFEAIPSGFIFVAGDHRDSFDSRYEEFGLVKEENLYGRCFGVMKKKGRAHEL